MRVPQTQVAIRAIQEEHDLLQAVLHGMLYLVRSIAKGEKTPDLRIFRAMLFYIREYPEKVHHPKEDDFLFRCLRERSPGIQATIDELESQHQRGDALAAELEHALTRYDLLGDSAFKAFQDLVEKYAAFYSTHMRLEEDQILPEALRVLTQGDWEEINDAFAANNDPLAGNPDKPILEKLFSMIVNIAPPPIGVGPAC